MFSLTIFALIIGLIGIIGLAIKKQHDRRKVKKNNIKDTVIVHQLGAGPYCPSLSPFVIKLETYLRMNNISYKNQYDRVMSDKGKTPWIEYNDDIIPDSHFAVEYLKEKFHVRVNDKLTAEQKAIGASFTLLAEDHLYWGLLLWRAVYDKKKTIFRLVGLNSIILWLFERKALSSCRAQGLGRHTEEQVIKLMLDDIRFISDALGKKKYFLGDTPTEVDCAMFGQLCQVAWQSPDSPMEKMIKEKHINIIEYCERMKSKYWPDWDELITHSAINHKHSE